MDCVSIMLCCIDGWIQLHRSTGGPVRRKSGVRGRIRHREPGILTGAERVARRVRSRQAGGRGQTYRGSLQRTGGGS